MRSRLRLSLIVLLLAGGCAGREETTTSGGLQPGAGSSAPTQPLVPPARVGLLLPLSGPGAGLGQDLLDAAQLALFDAGRTDLQLLPRDTGDKPEQAEAAARAALDCRCRAADRPALRPLGRGRGPAPRPRAG